MQMTSACWWNHASFNPSSDVVELSRIPVLHNSRSEIVSVAVVVLSILVNTISSACASSTTENLASENWPFTFNPMR